MAQQEAQDQLATTGRLPARLIVMWRALALWYAVIGLAEAGCYQLYSPSGAKIYEDKIPPFDISYPTESPAYRASRARGEYMLIMPINFCEPAYVEEDDSIVGGFGGGGTGRRSSGGYKGGHGNGQPCSGGLGGFIGCTSDGRWQCANGISRSARPCR